MLVIGPQRWPAEGSKGPQSARRGGPQKGVGVARRILIANGDPHGFDV